MNDTTNTQTVNDAAANQTAAADQTGSTAAAAPEAALAKRWNWKHVSAYAGAVVLATAASYVGLKLIRKPKVMADAAAAVVDAVTPAA